MCFTGLRKNQFAVTPDHESRQKVSRVYGLWKGIIKSGAKNACNTSRNTDHSGNSQKVTTQCRRACRLSLLLLSLLQICSK